MPVETKVSRPPITSRIEERQSDARLGVGDLDAVALDEIAPRTGEGQVVQLVGPAPSARADVIDVEFGTLEVGVHQTQLAAAARPLADQASRLCPTLAHAGFLPMN